jgi:outer membrane protein assembly factor BamB
MWMGPGSTGTHESALRALSSPPSSAPPRFHTSAPAWTSEARFGGTRAEVPDGRRAADEDRFDVPHHAGEGSPIAAQGAVFFGHYRPSGDVYDKYIAHRRLEKTQAELRAQKRSPVNGQVLKHERWLIGATDVLTAMDTKTGETLWETDLGHDGLNINIATKGGFGVTPAYDDGKVFFLGTGGHLYAVDASDGRLLWTSDLGERTLMQQYYRRMAESGATYAPRFRSAFLTAVAAARGVVVVSDEIFHRVNLGLGQDYHYDRRDGVMAFDADTGRRLWHREEVGGFKLWEHKGKPYILTTGHEGTRLFEQGSGRELWHHPEVLHEGNQTFGPAISQDHLVIFEPDSGHPVAYKIDPKGLKREWKAEAKARGNFLIAGELGYVATADQLLAIDMDSGRIRGERDYRGASSVSGNPYLIAAGDWILAPATGRGVSGVRLFPRHPEHFDHQPGLVEVEASTGYEVSILPAIGARHLFVRSDFAFQAFKLP